MQNKLIHLNLILLLLEKETIAKSKSYLNLTETAMKKWDGEFMPTDAVENFESNGYKWDLDS